MGRDAHKGAACRQIIFLKLTHIVYGMPDTDWLRPRMVTERYFVNTLDSKIGVGVEAFPVLTGFTRTSCWFSS